MKYELTNELQRIATKILEKEQYTDLEIIKQETQQLYDQVCIELYLERQSLEKESAQENDKDKSIMPLVSSDTKTLITEDLIIGEDETANGVADTKEITNKPSEGEIVDSEVNIEIQEEIAEKELPRKYELQEITSGFENLPSFEPLSNTSSETETPLHKEEESISRKTLENIPDETSKPTINYHNLKRNSINDTLQRERIRFGINERMILVKQLFDNDMAAYQNAIKQLNTAVNIDAAEFLMTNIIKPKYNNWIGKEIYEKQLLERIHQKFKD